MAALLYIFVGVTISLFCLSTVNGSICHYPGGAADNSSKTMAAHIFNDEKFWKHFRHQVELRSWKCNFPPDILYKHIDKDAKLYEDDTIFRHRRHGVSKLMKNESRWIGLILGACKEIADGRREGVHSQQLRHLHVLEALEDFVEHLNCFYTIALDMASKGRTVKPLSQDSSRIHDIDKLDPVMLVGYSERFEDNRTTSVWDECVDRHTHVNPHHQAHCIWHRACCDEAACPYCGEIAERALLEMVCDKVSRRLQKSLHGEIRDDMWDVDVGFFKGLPQVWLDRAYAIIESLKSDSKLDGRRSS